MIIFKTLRIFMRTPCWVLVGGKKNVRCGSVPACLNHTLSALSKNYPERKSASEHILWSPIYRELQGEKKKQVKMKSHDQKFVMRAPPRRRVKGEEHDDQPVFLRKAFTMISTCPPEIGKFYVFISVANKV